MLRTTKNLSVKASPKMQSFRPCLEALEERCLLSGGITTTTGLVNAIANANTAGGATTITLASGAAPFDFSAPHNSTNGGNALPVITGNITIVGNDDTIERSTAAGTPAFRLFDVASGGSLTLENLTLQGGLVEGLGKFAEGGAIFSSGALLKLNGVTVQNNKAEAGSAASDAYGGGIFYNGGGSVFLSNHTVINLNTVAGSNGSSGIGGGVCVLGAQSVTLVNDTFNSNQAIGASGDKGPQSGTGVGGGSGLGGGLYVSSSSPITLTISNDHFTANEAIGGQAGNGGNGTRGGGYGGAGGGAQGGGLDIVGSNLTLNGDTFSSNSATGGAGGNGGTGELLSGGNGGNGGEAFGGGVYTTALDMLLDTTFNQDTATGGAGGAGGNGLGGSGSNGGNGGGHGPLLYGVAMTLDPTSPLPTGTVGTAYNQTITAGIPPFSLGSSPIVYKYSVLSSSLGLQFNTNGAELLISGTPTAAGMVTFTVTASDSYGSYQPVAYSLTINPSPQPPAFTSPTSTTFVAGSSGTFTVAATGVPTPSLTESGILPGGIALRDNGNGTATLGGTPAVGSQGTYHFAIIAQNTAGSISQSFTLTVNSPPVPPSPPSPPAPPPPPTLNVPPLLAFFDSLLGAAETVNANGTETMTDYLFGFPLLVATFDNSGNLVSVDLFGFDVTSMFG